MSDVELIDIRGFSRIRMSHHVIRNDIDAQKQLKGILPNFVHSLDSSHLVDTVNRAKANGIQSFSMVHDSFGTHASDMPTLATALRAAFTGIYERNVLGEFHTWVSEVLMTADRYSATGVPTLTGADAESRLRYLLASWVVRDRAKHSASSSVDAKADKGKVKKPRMHNADQLKEFPSELNFAISDVEKSDYFFY